MERRGRGWGEVAASRADLPPPTCRAPSSAASASPASWATKLPAAARAPSACAPTAPPARATRRPTASWSGMARNRVWCVQACRGGERGRGFGEPQRPLTSSPVVCHRLGWQRASLRPRHGPGRLPRREAALLRAPLPQGGRGPGARSGGGRGGCEQGRGARSVALWAGLHGRPSRRPCPPLGQLHDCAQLGAGGRGSRRHRRCLRPRCRRGQSRKRGGGAKAGPRRAGWGVALARAWPQRLDSRSRVR